MKIRLSEFQYDKTYQVFRVPEHIRYVEEEYSYSDGKIEGYILEVIRKAGDISDDSKELMGLSKDWPSYYHLAAGRSNVIKCLDLNKRVKILELGSGCGAVTRYLGENFETVDCVEGSLLRAEITRERCRDLNNVRVFCSDIKALEFEHQYDVVTLIGVLEYAPVYFADDKRNPFHALLEIAKSALKSDGILIIAIENKIGLKYWNGYPEDHTGRLYDSIHGYPVDGTPETFSKRELKDFLNETGFCKTDFYHLFPDYKFVESILSDNGDERTLHLHNWISTPFMSCGIRGKFTFQERLALKTMSDAGLLREVANSFLVVAGNESAIVNKPEWAVKKFTMKRLSKYRCITTLKLEPKPSVEKVRLDGSKDKKIIGIIKYGNCQLEVSHNVSESTWYEGDMLSIEIYKALYKENFVEEISELLQRYLQKLLEWYAIGKDDEEGYPLLAGCSFDVLFRNIVVNHLGELWPIDTEWRTEESVSVDYVIYRCIMHDIVTISRDRIGNIDKFIVNQQKNLFPQYGNARNMRNKELEKAFYKQIVHNHNIAQSGIAQTFPFLANNRSVWVICRKTARYIKKLLKRVIGVKGRRL